LPVHTVIGAVVGAWPATSSLPGHHAAGLRRAASCHRSAAVFGSPHRRGQAMSLQTDNAAYEAWLRTQCQVVEADLAYKHERMKQSPFAFLRATYFRWAKKIEKLCPDLNDAPAVLSVGDTHTENFGTWRDADGRWIWGINDFDEAAVMAYPFDLVRLAASAQLAPGPALDARDVAQAITAGYRQGLEAPRPTLLDEAAIWLRPFVIGNDKDRVKFWNEVRKYPSATPPSEVQAGLRRNLPSDALVERFASRRKGGGGLGRPRFVAVATWRGGLIVREAKAIVPSAWDWVHRRPSQPCAWLDLANGKHRSPDPFLQVHAGFLVRRIAVDARKIDLGADAGSELTLKVLEAMGFDLGAIHAASEARAPAIRKDLDARPDGWLYTAATTSVASVQRDYASWTGTPS
jgi:hypothetical protein